MDLEIPKPTDIGGGGGACSCEGRTEKSERWSGCDARTVPGQDEGRSSELSSHIRLWANDGATHQAQGLPQASAVRIRQLW